MNDVLDNPVYNALLTGDAHRSNGTDEVKYFDKEVSLFAGIKDGYHNGFSDLHQMLPEGRRIIYASRTEIKLPSRWFLLHCIPGTQFIHTTGRISTQPDRRLVLLDASHVEEMIALTALTKPGPFDKRTIEFGYYHGIFENGKLVAMTGQRMHPFEFSEVSAVCTHPDYLGKGYAQALMEHQINLIYDQGQTPFLHVRTDNTRAIRLYERIGFQANGPMIFYFLKWESQ